MSQPRHIRTDFLLYGRDIYFKWTRYPQRKEIGPRDELLAFLDKFQILIKLLFPRRAHRSIRVFAYDAFHCPPVAMFLYSFFSFAANRRTVLAFFRGSRGIFPELFSLRLFLDVTKVCSSLPSPLHLPSDPCPFQEKINLSRL